MSELVFIRLRGRVQGPYEVEHLRTLAQRGQFSRLHEISSDGATWSRATTRPELFAPSGTAAAAVAQAIEAPQQPVQSGSAGTAPAEAWYYHVLGANQGPIDFSRLQFLASVGQVAGDTLVWKEGMSEWTPARSVSGLMSAPLAIPVEDNEEEDPDGSHSAPSSDEIPRVSALAVASLSLGILWICGLGSVLAVIFAPIALYQIQLSRGRIWGTNLAIAGLVLGAAVLALQLLLIMTGVIRRDQFNL